MFDCLEREELFPRVIVLHPHNILLVGEVVEISVDPEFRYDAHGIFADEAMTFATLKGNEVASVVLFGRQFFVCWACSHGYGPLEDGPHFTTAVVVLPTESLARINHKDFGTKSNSLVDGDAFNAGEEMVGKGLGILFLDDQKASPWAAKILIDNSQAFGLNPGGRFFHGFGVHRGKSTEQG